MEFIEKIINKIDKNHKNYHKFQLLADKYTQIKALIQDNLKLKENESDELKSLIDMENNEYEAELNDIVLEIKNVFLKDENNAIILEVRAGEGGDEASLFAFELMNMYQKLCKLLNYQFKILNLNTNEVNGLKEGIFEITGKHVHANLFSENGVHCVKRVPKTEKKGRIHTSTATVAVLKQPNDVEVIINEKDLKIETFRSSGPGGQSVNTTDSAIRITHLPTKIVVSQQDEKSQHKNKEKALKILKIRIYAKKLEEEEQKYAHLRKAAIGTAKRNERIRTYHFNQNYVKDTRVDSVCHNIEDFMEGVFLSKILDKLSEQYIIDAI